jgi:hypothetical protein
MKFFLAILFCTVTIFAQAQHPGKWKQLFNGKNLKGWTPKISKHELNDNFANTFRVRDGLLEVNYDGYNNFDGQYGHLFYKSPYAYYLIAVEYRFIGKQANGGEDWAFKNSGIMIHCQPPATMLKNQDFPISIEVQLLGGDSTEKRPTCNLCTPGTNVEKDGKLFTDHCLNSSSATYYGDQWVRAEVLVLGDSVVKHIVNGDTVMVYNRPQIGGGVVHDYDSAVKKDGQILSSGYISLQSESHPIQFRKVEIMNLEKYYGKKIDPLR